MAQKTEEPEKKGIIPISHVRLVYISDDGRLSDMHALNPSYKVHYSRKIAKI